MELAIDQLVGFIFRWIHFFAGVTWIGLLYYFNFVQGEYFKETDAGGKSAAIAKLVPRALWWFRYGALFTFLSGLALAGYLGETINFYIVVGMTMGTLMFLNVWVIIWPNQKIVIASNDQLLAGGSVDPAAAGAGAKAALASRTNTLFSLPMLFFMGASAHLGGAGSLPMQLVDESVSILGMVLSLLIIAAIEVNAIIGKLGPMTSVKGVIHSGLGLIVVLLVVVQYL